jgi:hypothetical protein
LKYASSNETKQQQEIETMKRNYIGLQAPVAKQQIKNEGMCVIYRQTARAAEQTAAHLTEWVRNRSCGCERLSISSKQVGGRWMLVGILFNAITGKHMVA